MITPKVNESRVVFGPCRLSYTHLMSRYAPDGGDGKYMTNVLIPKTEKETIKAIQQAISAAKQSAIVSKWNGKEPKKIDLPLRDGDEKDDEMYAGHYFLNAKSSRRPGVVDKQCNPIMDEDDVYSGMWAVLSVTFYGYDVSGNRGIACGLNHVMKFKDDEHLGGRSSAESDFKGIMLDFDDDEL